MSGSRRSTRQPRSRCCRTRNWRMGSGTRAEACTASSRPSWISPVKREWTSPLARPYPASPRTSIAPAVFGWSTGPSWRPMSSSPTRTSRTCISGCCQLTEKPGAVTQAILVFSDQLPLGRGPDLCGPRPAYAVSGRRCAREFHGDRSRPEPAPQPQPVHPRSLTPGPINGSVWAGHDHSDRSRWTPDGRRPAGLGRASRCCAPARVPPAGVARNLRPQGPHQVRRGLHASLVGRTTQPVKGSTHGLSHKLTQMAFFRPSNRHRRYRNLYFVGASTHPGTGVPMAMVSGRFAAQRIAAEHR